MAWPMLECEWCGEQVRLIRADRSTFRAPEGWTVVDPPAGYLGGSRIAHTGTCEKTVREEAVKEADTDAVLAAAEIAPTKAGIRRLALSEDQDRWRRTAG